MAFGVPKCTIQSRLMPFASFGMWDPPSLVTLPCMSRLMDRANSVKAHGSKTTFDICLASSEFASSNNGNAETALRRVREVVARKKESFQREMAKPGWRQMVARDEDMPKADLEAEDLRIWSEIANSIGFTSDDTKSWDRFFEALLGCHSCKVVSRFVDKLVQAHVEDEKATLRSYPGLVRLLAMQAYGIKKLEVRTESLCLGRNLLDNRTLLSCNFGPYGSEKRSSIAILADEASGYLFLEGITSFGMRIPVGVLTYFLTDASIRGQQCRALLVDSFESGLRQITDSMDEANLLMSRALVELYNLFFDSEREFEWILVNSCVTSSVAGKFVDFVKNLCSVKTEQILCKKLRLGDEFHLN